MGRISRLVELTFPEYRDRHIFTTKLRIAIFIGFWVLYLYFLKDVLSQTKVITGIICVSSFLTGIAYYNVVVRNKLLLLSFSVEMIADLVTMTCVIYLTGGPYSNYFTIYFFYCFAAGVFYNHYLAGIVALFCIMFYGAFLLLCNWGIIPPLILNYGDSLPIPTYTPLAHFFFTVVFIGLAIYAVKIASFFSQKRERMLEARNIELEGLHEKLREVNEQLREANRVKSEFLAIMSHELRTPLTAIIGFSELLMEGVLGDLTDEQKDSIQEVLNNGADLLELINSLLDLSKIDSGKMRFEIHPFDMSEMVDRVSRMISSLIQRKEHDFTVSIQKDLPAIMGDERKLQRVLLNLISNAIKFTPDKGMIKVWVKFFPSIESMKTESWYEKIKNIQDRYSEGIFCIGVEDNGVGIKSEHLDIVFDLFQQADSSVTRSYGGTGLGLALAKQYIEQHNGIIWAESEYGKGAKFFVLLPRIAKLDAVKGDSINSVA